MLKLNQDDKKSVVLASRMIGMQLEAINKECNDENAIQWVPYLQEKANKAKEWLDIMLGVLNDARDREETKEDDTL